MKSLRWKLLVPCLALAAVAPAAQTQRPPVRATGTVQAETTAILVDVVVRDKHGQPVTDLVAGDFELYEDGVPQDVGAVMRYTSDADRRVTTSAPSGPPAPADAAPPAKTKVEAAPEPVVALVFDRLAPEARVLARKAALGYVGEGAQSDARIAIFGIDLSLLTYQTYTRNAAMLRKAITDVGVRSTGQFESQADKARAAGQQSDAAAGAMAVLEAGGQAAGQAAAAGVGAAGADAKLADMQRRTLETFEMLERDEQGASTTNALVAVVNSMRALPGRKSVIFFSEGVAIPANVAARFRSVIDTANRANVSIYAMDAGGLRAESTSKDTRDSINAAAGRMLRRNPTVDVVGAPMTEALERNEDMLRRDPHIGLGQLANETGGILIRNTNDLTGGFKRLDEDMRNYYMLSYVPKNDRFDGKFRTIGVKVKRPGSEVAARKGYYAVRGAGPLPVMSYEARPLALLESTPLPNAFPVRAAALKFPQSGALGLTPVLVSLPASAMTFVPTEDKASYRAEFTVLVRFRNAANEVVDKMSQSYVLTGPMDRLESVKQGNVLFYRERELRPGVYSMEAIVHDVGSDRASVRLATVEEPQLDPSALRVSDLMLVASAERVAKANRPSGSPFLVGDMLLYPNLGEPVRKSVTPELGFFFTAYPGKGSKPQATLELMQNGTRLVALPLTLGEPDSSGRIQHVSRLPIGNLAAGTYDLRVLLADGRQQISRSTIFRIVD
jgi:VWFA-related protein